MEDMECGACLHYSGKKGGCKLDKCCCEEEKREAIANNRIKRPKGWFFVDEWQSGKEFTQWDG
jgi:hypothetical protein